MLPQQQELDQALEALRQTRTQTLGLLASATQAQLDQRPPSPSGRVRWSAGEVFDHLILAERFQREELVRLLALARSGQPPTVRRSFADFDVSVAFIPKPLLPFLEVPFTLGNLFMPEPVRDFLITSRLLPAQNPRQAEPRRERSTTDLDHDLRTNLAEIERLVTDHQDINFHQLRLDHPLLGSNDGLGILRFMANHERRHHEQLVETLRATDPKIAPAEGHEMAEEVLNTTCWRQARRETLRLVEPLSEDQTRTRPHPDKWSIGEVLDHLLKTEAYFAAELTLLIDNAASGRSRKLERSFTEVAGSLFNLPPWAMTLLEGPLTLFNYLLPHEARRKVLASSWLVVRSPKSLEPVADRDLTELRRELSCMVALDTLCHRVSNVPNLAYNDLELNHPVLGRHRGLGEVFGQAAAHEERHQRQIRNILAALPVTNEC